MNTDRFMFQQSHILYHPLTSESFKSMPKLVTLMMKKSKSFTYNSRTLSTNDERHHNRSRGQENKGEPRKNRREYCGLLCNDVTNMRGRRCWNFLAITNWYWLIIMESIKQLDIAYKNGTYDYPLVQNCSQS